MFNDKAFSVTGYDSIVAAFVNAKNYGREVSSLDLLVGIYNQCGKINRIFLESGHSQHNINRLYGDLQLHNQKENFNWKSIVQTAENVSQLWGDNDINCDHLFLSLLKEKNSYTNNVLRNLNYNLQTLELKIVEEMGKPDFLFSYEDRKNFWNRNFIYWITTSRFLLKKIWEVNVRENHLFSVLSSDKKIGLVIKESDNTFNVTCTEEKGTKTLVVTTSFNSVSLVKNAFIGFSLGMI